MMDGGAAVETSAPKDTDPCVETKGEVRHIMAELVEILFVMYGHISNAMQDQIIIAILSERRLTARFQYNLTTLSRAAPTIFCIF